jgi:hypothetical protein
MREAFPMHDALTMLPEAQARRQLAGHPLRFTVLRPPYPALGVGTLRVLRVRENAQAELEVIAGYDNYERLGDRRTCPTNDDGRLGRNPKAPEPSRAAELEPSSAAEPDPLG